MNSTWLGWGLAAVAVVGGTWRWGWQGTVMALSVVVFWLLLQFSRGMRTLRSASRAPVGSVPSAVMLNARLQMDQRMLEVLALTRSLGRRLSDDPEVYVWQDSGGDRVEVELQHGRVTRWKLVRESDAATPG